MGQCTETFQYHHRGEYKLLLDSDQFIKQATYMYVCKSGKYDEWLVVKYRSNKVEIDLQYN